MAGVEMAGPRQGITELMAQAAEEEEAVIMVTQAAPAERGS